MRSPPRENSEPKFKVACIAKRWQHHTASGGYDRLARELGADTIQRPAESRALWHRAIRRWWRFRNESWRYLLDYCYEDWLAEWSLIARARLQSPDAVHVLYGDEQLDVLLKHRKLLPCPLIVSFHLPASRVKERFESYQKHLLLGIDGAVVVAQCQLGDLASWLGSDRVFYVPHGIDVATFSPGESDCDRGGPVRIVVVGDHMRDWNALHRIIDHCSYLKLAVEFDVVARERYWTHFIGCSGVRLRTAISERELVALYRGADALLVPVTDATANNAVLEAMGCGTPVISNNVGGMPDYVDDSCGWLFKSGEVEAIVDLLRNMSQGKSLSLNKRMPARNRALLFSWERVVQQLRTVYKNVIQRGNRTTR